MITDKPLHAAASSDTSATGTFALSRLLTAASALTPDAVAVRQCGRVSTWQELADRVARYAAALRNAGIQPGDRVAALAGNSDALYTLLLAIPWAGAILVPLNTRLAGPELAQCLEECAPRLLLTDAAHAARAEELARAGGMERIVRMDLAADDPAGLAGMAAACEPLPDQGRGGEDPAVLCFTGGTTGRAKAVVLTHRSLIAGAQQWHSVARLDRGDSLLIAAPMFHLAALSNCYGALLIGAACEIMERFEAEEALATIARERVSYAVLVPVMIRALIEHPAIGAHDLGCLRRITYGGSPISEPLLRQALAHLPATEFVQIYGQTESGVTTALLPAEHDPAQGHLTSAGRPVAGVELRIAGDGAEAAANGDWGEICVRSPGVAAGYWNRPEETADSFRGGWLHTGDIGFLDAAGYLHVVDRAKDMIISGGENVYSAEVERVLESHPAVTECAVIGQRSERWGEEVCALVRLHSDSGGTTASLEDLEQDLTRHCRESLAAYKCPRSFQFRQQPFPRSATGKILKRALREGERDA